MPSNTNKNLNKLWSFLFMSIRLKLGLSYVVLIIIIIACGLGAEYGIQTLSDLTDMFIGPLWNSADGAMNSIIEVQNQMIMIHELLLNQADIEPYLKKITQSKELIKTQIYRLNDKIISQKKQEDLNLLLENYEKNLDQTLKTYQYYSTDSKNFHEHAISFIELGSKLEEQIGDKALDELEKTPDQMFSWSSGLRERWLTADHVMESSIHLLWQLYHIQQITLNADFMKNKNKIIELLSWQKNNIEQMLKLDSYKIADEIFPQKTVGENYWENFQEHQKLILQMINSFEKFKAQLILYKTSEKDFDLFIEQLENELDQHVEEESQNISNIQKKIRFVIWSMPVLGVILALSITFLMKKSVITPLLESNQIFEEASKGDLTKKANVKSKDEIGKLANTLNLFFTNLRESLSAISKNAEYLSGASSDLTSISNHMNHNAEDTYLQANLTSAASEQISRNIQTVATGAEEMTVTIKEIARNANEAAKIANESAEMARKTNHTIKKLGESSLEIGQVINVINTIAHQTKLLALNATIEAARAGDAGRGFAVVANEVKELAQETAKATKEISTRIETIQQDSQNAVIAIEQICTVIEKINDIQNTIATAMEEQTITTKEISNNIAESAKGSSEIAQNVTKVAEIANATSNSSNDTKKSADKLAEIAIELKKLVSHFKF